MRAISSFSPKARKRFLGRNILLAFVAMGGLLPDNSRADITPDPKRDYTYIDGERDDIMPKRIDFIGINRMGMATFEGHQYYACVARPGKDILVMPADSDPYRDGWPTFESSLQLRLDTSHPGSRDPRVQIYDDEVTFMAGLFVRDAQLYAVYITRGTDDRQEPYKLKGNRIYIQPMRTAGKVDPAHPTLPRRLEPVRKRYEIEIQEKSNELNFATVVSGDNGIYIHALYGNGPQGNCYLRTYLLSDISDGDNQFKLISSKLDLGPENVMAYGNASASDAVGTHQFNSIGKLEEVHHIMWARKDKTIMTARYRPNPSPGVPSYEVNATPFKGDQFSHSVFTLVEGNLRGVPSNDFGITLVDVSRAGNPYISQHRALFYSTTTNTFIRDWVPLDFPFNHDGFGLQMSSAVHWGIDRDRIVPTPESKEESLGPDGTKFHQALQQSLRMSSITYEDGSTQYVSVTVKGNKLVTDTSVDPQGLKVCNTGDGDETGDDTHFRAWTLISVIHGLPPYVEIRKSQPAPTLSFSFSETVSSATGVSDSTEDSKEVSFAASTGGGAMSAVFSAEASYSYGLKTVIGNTSTSTVSKSSQATETFNPVNYLQDGSPDPASLGLLIYSAPRFTSKNYSVRQWDGSPFNGTQRNTFLTVVSKRTLQFITYVLDHPERGPVQGHPLKHIEKLKPLTEGMAPVPPTSSLNQWRTSPVPDVNEFPSFKNTNASIDAADGLSGNFAFNFIDTDSETQSQLESKTSKTSIKIAGGIKGLFNVNVSGATSTTSSFGITNTNTTSIGQGISGTFPSPWHNVKDGKEEQPYSEVQVEAKLVYPESTSINQKPAATWIPTAFKGQCAPFLLTWTLTKAIRSSRPPLK